MRKILLAIATSIFAAGSASAADIAARPYTKAPVIAPVYDWSGIYLGADAGWQGSRIGLSNPTPGNPLTYDPQHDSFALGAHVGYQKQWGQFVLGIEGGYTAGFDEVSFTTPSISIFSPGGTATTSAKLKDLWTVGGRIGWAPGNVLLYATGGYANGAYGFSAVNTGGVGAQNGTARLDGAYIGVGVDWAPFNNNWLFGVEYRHYEFDARTINVASTGFVFVEPIRFDPTTDTVMGRISYKFNWDAPLVAKY